MKHILLVLVLALSGCVTMPSLVVPEENVAVQIEYVIKIPPAELLTIPPAVPKINVDAAQQSDIAKWVLASEARTRTLESLIQQLAVFFNNQEVELKQSAALLNEQALAEKIKADAKTATEAILKPVKK